MPYPHPSTAEYPWDRMAQNSLSVTMFFSWSDSAASSSLKAGPEKNEREIYQYWNARRLAYIDLSLDALLDPLGMNDTNVLKNENKNAIVNKRVLCAMVHISVSGPNITVIWGKFARSDRQEEPAPALPFLPKPS